MRKHLLGLIVSLLFIGCVSGGRYFEFADAKTVKVGDTREVIVKKMKDEPYMVKTSKKGDDIVEIYVYTYVSPTYAIKSISFILKDGIVIEVPFISPAIKD